MKKLLELEEKLKKARAELEKNAMMGYGNDAATGMPMGTAGSGDVNMSKEEHCDEEDKKADKKMIESKMDEHNEKMHGEAKDKDSAKKYDDMDKREGTNTTANPVEPGMSAKYSADTELIKYNAGGQWSLSKATMTPKPDGEFDVPVKEVYDGDDEYVHVGSRGVDGDKPGKERKVSDDEKRMLKD